MAKTPDVSVTENETPAPVAVTTVASSSSVTTTTDNSDSSNNSDQSDSGPTSRTTKTYEIKTRKVPLAATETWFTSRWRPAMAWLWAAVIAFDFIIAPILSMLLPKFIPGVTYIPWKPISGDGGGMIHMALGAVVGITAYGRTQEKIRNVEE
jgi:hypothetical protein